MVEMRDMDMDNNKISVLVVDDEEMIVTILLNYLGEKGYKVTGLCDPTEAMEILKTTKFDIVFTDLMMPIVNGMELVKEIRQQEVDTQVIIFTGYASIDSAIDAVQQGVYDYIKKPFRLEDIETILTHAVEKQQLQRENKILHAKIKAMLGQITMLYDISNIIYQVKEKKYALEMVFDTLAESMQISTALIGERHRNGSSFKLSHSSTGGDKYEALTAMSENSELNGQTLSSTEPVAILDVGKQIEMDDKKIDLPDECRRIVFIPIKYQGNLEGYLITVEHKDHLYSHDDELTLLKILATQIAPIIGSSKKSPKVLASSEKITATNSAKELIKAELVLSDSTETPVSFAFARLVAGGIPEDESEFTLMRETWRNMIATQLGSSKRLCWIGIDTLLIVQAGGNPVGLDHHLANVRNEMEGGNMSSDSPVKFSMAYSISTYPFDGKSAKKITTRLSSRLFYDASEIRLNQ